MHVASTQYKNCGLKASKENTIWETLALMQGQCEQEVKLLNK
jgi:hypothetical protein